MSYKVFKGLLFAKYNFYINWMNCADFIAFILLIIDWTNKTFASISEFFMRSIFWLIHAIVLPLSHGPYACKNIAQGGLTEELQDKQTRKKEEGRLNRFWHGMTTFAVTKKCLFLTHTHTHSQNCLFWTHHVEEMYQSRYFQLRSLGIILHNFKKEHLKN